MPLDTLFLSIVFFGGVGSGKRKERAGEGQGVLYRYSKYLHPHDSICTMPIISKSLIIVKRTSKEKNRREKKKVEGSLDERKGTDFLKSN